MKENMNTNGEKEKDNIKTLSENPEYFGSYLNLARLNIYNISNHIAHKLELNTIDNEEKIINSFLTKYDAKDFKAKESLIFAVAKRFFPISKVFNSETLPDTEKSDKTNFGKDIQAFTKALRILFSAISDFRNNFTHYYSFTTKSERSAIVTEELKQFLEANFQRGIIYTKQRFKDVFKDEDFELASQTILINRDNTITQDGLVFLTAMFLDRENAFQYIGKIKGLKGTQYNSFLAKREVLMAYCITLPSDKLVSDNPIQGLSLDIINELSKCPKDLYHVITESEQKQFHPTIENLVKVIENSVPDSIDDYENYIQSISKRVRHENRFSYFALKYIDSNKLLENIRFQIDLGKLILDEYPKTLAGENVSRRVVENVKAFIRLQDLQDENWVLSKINKSNVPVVFEQYAPHYNLDNNKIGIALTEQFPTYYFNEKKEKQVKSALRQPIISAFLSIHELPKMLLLEFLQKGKAEKIIENFIVVNNTKLFNWEFIENIKSQLQQLEPFQKRSQGKIKVGHDNSVYKNESADNLKNRKEVLNEILKAHELNDKQIPTKILDYWLNIVDVEENRALSDRIKLMKIDCKDRIKALQRHTETGKGKVPKIGEMATFVAKDIVDMIIDVEKKKKITSFYYDKIQECLALYADPNKKAQLIQILKSDLKLYENGGHPFLHKISFEDIRFTKDLYKKYLEEKGKKVEKVLNRNNKWVDGRDNSWMHTTFYFTKRDERKGKNMTEVTLPKDMSGIPYSIRQFAKAPSTLQDWFRSVTNGISQSDNPKPIDLPTNLFDAELKITLQNILTNKNVHFDINDNYSKLFKIWWEQIREDQNQSYYQSERAYDFEGNILNLYVDTKIKFEDYLSDNFVETIIKSKETRLKSENKKEQNLTINDVRKKAALRIKLAEKEVRLRKEEDRLMLLMFESMSSIPNCKLHQIDTLMNGTDTIKQSVEGTLHFLPDGSIDKFKSKKIFKKIVEVRKRKEYSVLKKYVHDRRLPELFEYFTHDEIPISSIKIELEAYNKSRDEVFQLVFTLEKTMINKFEREILEHTQTEKSHLQHKPYLQWLLDMGKITENDFRFLNLVRNAFSHNLFPHKATMDCVIPKWESERYAQQILELYREKINYIINIL